LDNGLGRGVPGALPLVNGRNGIHKIDMKLLQTLFDNNEKWAAGMVARDPLFFDRLVDQQRPQFLWIGCSDSRVSADQITGLMPGEIFVHRNIANIVQHSDMNCMSVIQYAVDVLKVRHVIVVGHYGCGGVKAALDDSRVGLVDHWLHPVRQIVDRQPNLLAGEKDHAARFRRLCEANVLDQTRHAFETTFVRDAWARGQELAVHGWIYDLRDGRLRDLHTTVTSQAEADQMIATGALTAKRFRFAPVS
jgi:carbonic anhydrase